MQGVDGGVDAHLEGVVLRWVEGLCRGVDVVGQGYGDDALGALLLLQLIVQGYLRDVYQGAGPLDGRYVVGELPPVGGGVGDLR